MEFARHNEPTNASTRAQRFQTMHRMIWEHLGEPVAAWPRDGSFLFFVVKETGISVMKPGGMRFSVPTAIARKIPPAVVFFQNGSIRRAGRAVHPDRDRRSRFELIFKFNGHNLPAKLLTGRWEICGTAASSSAQS